jgi:membrane protein DedA with SNARE-associated domain
MPLAPFLMATTVGTMLWTFFLRWAGYLLAENYNLVGGYAEPITKLPLAG